MSVTIPHPLRAKVSGATFRTNPYRMLLAQRLLDNGGHGSYPIAYDVSLSCMATDWDSVLANLKRTDHVSPEAFRVRSVVEEVRDEYDADRLWNWTHDSMLESLKDSDCYRTYGPTTAARYGLPDGYGKRIVKPEGAICYYPAGKTSRGTQIVFDGYRSEHYQTTFELRGPGSKYLVIAAFEDVELASFPSQRLAEILLRNDEQTNHGFSNYWCHKLLAMMDEWSSCFSSEAINKEFDYQFAFHLGQEFDAVYETHRTKVDLGRMVHRIKKATQQQSPSAYNW